VNAFMILYWLYPGSKLAQEIVDRFFVRIEEVLTKPSERRRDFYALGVLPIKYTQDADDSRKAVQLLRYYLDANIYLAVETLKRLVPAFEQLLNDTMTPDGLKQDIISVLGIMAQRGIVSASSIIERHMPTLEAVVMDAGVPYKKKKGIIEAVSLVVTVPIKGPQVNLAQEIYSQVKLAEVLLGIDNANNPRFIARSLVYDIGQGKEVLVIKLLREREQPIMLLREAFWMGYLDKLKQEGCFKGIRFDIPKKLEFSGANVIMLEDITIDIPAELKLHPQHYALCFLADKDYFTYLNDSVPQNLLLPDEFKEAMLRCSYLLGRLVALGIIHTDIIPLFHTWTQANTRSDRGLYRWWLCGRLRNWLLYCDYPNMGKTGIRDFEHFMSWGIDPFPSGYNDIPGLYHIIGTQFLSLLLIVGSYFRNKDRKRCGFDSDGDPVDARDLFDKVFLKQVLEGIFLEYYRGFTNKEYTGVPIVDIDALAQEVINEMGVDRYIVEFIPQYDQKEIPDELFKEFLKNSSLTDEEKHAVQKCQKSFSTRL
jgi:hypothetical protein